MSVSQESLRLSSKGKLKYDRHWHRDGKLSTILEQIANDQRFVALHPSCLPETNNSWCRSASSGKHDSDIATYNVARDPGQLDIQHVVSPKKCSGGIHPLEEFIMTSRSHVTCDELTHTVKTEMEIREYESQQRMKIQEKVDSKRESFGRFLGILYEKSLLELKMLGERRRFLNGIQERKLQAETEADQDELKRRHQKLRNDHESFAKMADERLKEASLRDKQEEEEALKRVELRQKISALAACKQHVSATYQEIVSVVRSCHNLHLVPEDVRSAVQSMNEVVADVQKILDRVRTGKVDDSDIELMSHLETKTNTCLEIITLGVELANKAAEAERNAPSQGEAPVNLPSPIPSTVEVVAAPLVNNLGILKSYLTAMATLNNAMDSYKDLSTNPNLKTCRGNFKVGINELVNAISGQSGSQLRDKMSRLCAILSGRQVDLSRGRRFSIDDHPQGRIFYIDKLAMKFVNQAENDVSSNPSAAYPIAVVIVGLWKAFPAFGELLLAHYYVKCPYLVPYHPPRSAGLSDIDYHRELGYLVVDGVLEEQSAFLKRISGIVRLYAAVILSPVPKESDLSHPHGAECGWQLLSCTLSIDPLPGITATVLFHFLEVCGNALQKTYGKQFQKLLFNLCRDYIPKIKAVSPEDFGGPTSRLETFLQNCIARGQIAEPEGVLPPNFWVT